ncbi:SDR family NAD(P)-dependent oxidoreductase [Polymorphobacter fuscus]|uniref:SDR family NAD(P)-dependent oxidoreductase n=1 Tax=Sandarakinorhabdus fusca TaxID=1439888 RepID=A0A7C9GVR9_9SPHN|nr:SDR family oxidoreductase [Polymorphobacter fuscus]KAB7646288.1 SDR family oxidoreductase [Polymorphobacter fuscus]MQT17509.1 SDR family NAD(P)-dependent oxidoreductase [Polymorphobacter fuscus]NJC09952.1 NAD(P)-dependent dehydrogenase (short-subunit alcohol dehydrogenase family) [Polymorphobacter fuscus]
MTPASFSAIGAGNLAVITGAASGIGFATAEALGALGMRVLLVDRAGEALAAATAAIDGATAFAVDVADRTAMTALAAAIAETHGPVSVLMNNAGVGGGGDVFAAPEAWETTIGTNLFGVLNGVQAFVPAMVDNGLPGLIVNTGSKQGITQPPGNTAYNVSKAGVKALSEGLAHSLRERTGDRVTAHLLIPGFTFTGMTRPGAGAKPAAAWTSEQVVERMMQGLAAGDFYILCPDNETTPEQDARRIAWAAGDIIENRPALSRWHPDWASRFADFMRF